MLNEEIIFGLVNQDRKILNNIYFAYFSQVQHYIFANNGNDADAKDIFQDGLIVLYTKISHGTLNLNCHFSTLLYAICKNLWLQKLTQREKRKHIQFDDHLQYYSYEPLEEAEQIKREKLKEGLFNTYFSKLDKRRQNMLKFSADKSIPEVAQHFGLTINSAKNKKCLCKRNLKKLIQNDERYKLLNLET